MIGTIKIIIALSCILSADTAPQPALLPQDIAKYYKCHNFVAAFSSLSERRTLARFDSIHQLPEELNSPRMRAVYARIQVLKAMEMGIDPEIVFPRMFRSRQVASGGIVQIEKVRSCGNGSLVIESSVYRLDAGSQAALLALYEDAHGMELPQDLFEALSFSHKEIHYWVQQEGNGFKKSVPIVLLGQ